MFDDKPVRAFLSTQRAGHPPDLVNFVNLRRVELVEAFATLPDDPFDFVVQMAAAAAGGAALFPSDARAALERFAAAAANYRAAERKT